MQKYIFFNTKPQNKQRNKKNYTQGHSDAGAKPRYPIFFSFSRNWFANGLNGRRGEGVGYGLGFGRFVGGLFGFRGANEAHTGNSVGGG